MLFETTEVPFATRQWVGGMGASVNEWMGS